MRGRSSGGGCVIANAAPTVQTFAALDCVPGDMVRFHVGGNRCGLGKCLFHGVSMHSDLREFHRVACVARGARAPRRPHSRAHAAMPRKGWGR